MSGLTIALIIMVVVLVLGGGGCLMCVGLAAVVKDGEDNNGTTTTTTTAAPPPNAPPPAVGLTRNAVAREVEGKLRAKGLPVRSVACPAPSTLGYACELVTDSGDRAQIRVTPAAGGGFDFTVLDVAILEGAKLAQLFQSSVASKVDARLRVPCFTGILMKRVGTQFTCDVFAGATPSGSVTVTVEDEAGKVNINYTVTQTFKPTPTGAKRTVDFVCPAGQPPSGVVRAGCMCGSQILGSACGTSGFTDVTPTARGCLFVCN
jgi:hypothetical protein